MFKIKLKNNELNEEHIFSVTEELYKKIKKLCEKESIEMESMDKY